MLIVINIFGSPWSSLMFVSAARISLRNFFFSVRSSQADGFNLYFTLCWTQSAGVTHPMGESYRCVFRLIPMGYTWLA